MLKISKALSAAKLENYHKQEFTSPDQSYWSQGQTVQGEWQGQLTEKYGLTGAVSADEFHRLSDGQHPQTGEQLVQHRQSFEYQGADGKTVKSVEHRAGWDATFSAPKSVSLTALVGGDSRVREAHRMAVTTALGELERYTQARLGGNRPAESTGQFIVAKFEHDTSRPVDGYAAPQLHTHAVIFNVTERADGSTRALQPQSLFESQQFATAVYQSELTFRLREFGYEIAPGRSGAPEIKGYSQEYLDASSQRQNQILAHMQQNGLSGYEAAEIAAHATRDKKQIQSPAEVLAAHRKLAAEFGNQPNQVVAAARERGQKKSAERAPERVQKVAQEAVTFARERSFEREAVTDVQKDEEQAAKWYRKAAEQGDPSAQFNLGLDYVKGEGVSKDSAAAAVWLLKAAEQGHAAAQSRIGDMYDDGNGVEKDPTQAANWYRKAAAQGNKSAQNNLGQFYLLGHGVQKDPREAAMWFRKAAEQGEVQAQTSLGTMYGKGVGVQKNTAEAVRWYRRAAEQGDSIAQYNLAFVYIEGDGIPQDFTTAYMWANLSAMTGDKAKPLLGRMDALLSPQQISEGKRLTREWLAKHR